MLTRTITIQANPPQQIVLYFDSRSNAEKPFVSEEHNIVCVDDYGQRVSIYKDNTILSDLVTDVAENYRAHGEIEIKQMEAQLKFDERIKKIPTIDALVQRKRTRAAMANMPRVPMPAGMQG